MALRHYCYSCPSGFEYILDGPGGMLQSEGTRPRTLPADERNSCPSNPVSSRPGSRTSRTPPSVLSPWEPTHRKESGSPQHLTHVCSTLKFRPGGLLLGLVIPLPGLLAAGAQGRLMPDTEPPGDRFLGLTVSSEGQPGLGGRGPTCRPQGALAQTRWSDSFAERQLVLV